MEEVVGSGYAELKYQSPKCAGEKGWTSLVRRVMPGNLFKTVRIPGQGDQARQGKDRYSSEYMPYNGEMWDDQL